MTVSTIGTDFDQSLDVHRNIFAEIAFDVAFVLDDLTDTVHFVFAKILNLLVAIDIGARQNSLRARIPDAVNVSQRNHRVLVARKINTCNACHNSQSLVSGRWSFAIPSPLAAFAVDQQLP